MLLLPAPEMRSVNIPFAGFYGSIWDQAEDGEADNFIDSLTENSRYAEVMFPAYAGAAMRLANEGKMGELLWGATSYGLMHYHIAKEYALEFANWLSDSLGRDVAYEWEEMTSPKFYNFETDKLFAKFSLTDLDQILRALLEADGGAILRDTIIGRHRSRDGFISFYSDDLEEWLMKPLSEWDHNELGTLVRAWGEFNKVSSFDELLWDWRPGGLYEEVNRAFDKAVDWDGLREAVQRIADAWAEEEGIPLSERPVPRCQDTLELPL